MKMHPLLIAIITVNVLVLIISLLLPQTVFILALSPMMSAHYRPWQWITHLFLHNGPLHLFFNMYSIAVLGQPLLETMRTWKWAVLYGAGGLAGAAAYVSYKKINNTEPILLAGASGAAFALLAAFALHFPRARLGILFLPFEMKAQYFVLILVMYEIFAQVSGISLFGRDIAHTAHLGGAAMGASLACLWQKRHIHIVK